MLLMMKGSIVGVGGNGDGGLLRFVVVDLSQRLP